jgi:hypothetical protein
MLACMDAAEAGLDQVIHGVIDGDTMLGQERFRIPQ